MKVSLIISTYNRPEVLFLVLQSIECQLIKPYEVIIADDGSSFETEEIINKFKMISDLNIIHSWQKDIGFRAAKSRNKAILKSSGEYIVLIDGDTILHSKFIVDHIKNAEKGFFSQGTRVLLTKNKTKKILDSYYKKLNFFTFGLNNRKNAIHLNVLSKIFSKKKNNMHGIKSCNMGFYKQDCEAINGFNNDFEGWGREDSDFVARLFNIGVNRKTLRFNAIQFHLWHQENSRSSLVKNDLLLTNTINNKVQRCENGIDSLKDNLDFNK